MKTKMKKWLIGGLTVGAVVAPITSAVACGDGSSTIQTDKIIKDTDKIFADNYGENSTYADFKKSVDTQNDAQTASSNFISQIKYELTETLYNKEQSASFDYQIAFLKWDIFTKEKAQMILVKEMAAQIYDANTTSAQISNGGQTSGNVISVQEALNITETTSKGIFESVNKMSKDPKEYTKTPGTNISDERKAVFNKDLSTFQTNFKGIEELNKKLDELSKVDKNNNSSWTGWDSSTLTTDYSKLLRPLSKIRESQQKVYNEAKATTIDKYKTTGGGVEAWASERTSKYGGASTDEEAVKYLVNQQIQGTAFGKYTYALDSSYTIEQLLAKDTAGKHIFPWFEGYDDIDKIGDKNGKAQAATSVYIWTNDISKFKDSKGKLISISTSDIKDQTTEVTSLLSKNIFFLSRKTLVSDEIIAKLDSDQEKSNFQNGSPIMITHSLIGAKQGTSSNLVWTVTKDSLKNLLGFTKEADITKAHLGIDLFTKLYMDSAKDETDLFNQYVSDDTGSRANNGELGVQTYQWYARKGGMNDGFALASMVAYSDLRNSQQSSGTKLFELDKALDITTGERKILDLETKILNKIPQDILSGFIQEGGSSTTQNSLSLKEAIDRNGDTFKTNVTTADVNTQISNWIDSLTDDEVKVMFGSIFKEVFANRTVVYELVPSTTGGVKNRFLLASPDSGVHIIKITADAVDWQAKFEDDMKNVASEDNASKAKIDWATIYKNFFTDNEIISNLLRDVKDSNNVDQPSEFANQIKEIPTKNLALFDEWVKAGYVTKEVDAAANGKAIITSINKSIEATRIDANSQSARDSLTDRINTYLIGQMDNKFMDATIEPTSLYNELLKSLLP